MSLPSTGSSGNEHPLRGSFTAALEQLERYPIERNWRPAFLTPLSLLPPPRRIPLADPQGVRPAVMPFAQQPLTLGAAVRGLRSGSLTVAAVVEQAQAAIDRGLTQGNVWAAIAPRDELRRHVDDLDRELRAGVCRGLLHGIPLVVEEWFEVGGMAAPAFLPTPGSSAAQPDAGSVRLLKAAGALILGKLYTREPSPGLKEARGMGWAGAAGRDAGSLAASAVAAGMGLGAVAANAQAPSSIEAVACGVAGCRPTFGLVPSDGMLMLSWSLDGAAHLAATVEDAALLLDVLDPHPHVQYSQGLYKSLRGVQIGLSLAALEGAEEGVTAALSRAVAALRQAGAAVVEVEIPAAGDFEAALGLWRVIREAEAAAYHGAPSVEVSAIHYLQAQRAREDLRWRMLRCFDQFDALLMPTTRMPGTASAYDAGEWRHNSLLPAQNCLLWSLLGFPTISQPCGRTPDGVGIGAQLAAAPYEDARLLSIAAALELEMQRG